jgi:hypothetical protein
MANVWSRLMSSANIIKATSTSIVTLALMLAIMVVSAQSDDATTTPQPFITNTPHGQLAPTLTATPEAELQNEVLALVLWGANVRAEASTESEIVTWADAGRDFRVTTQDVVNHELWYQVALPDGGNGWLHSSTSSLVSLWSRVVETFDDVEMVLVPAGCFPMGSVDTESEEDERPIYVQCFDEPFWVDRYEVSNLAYGTAGRWSGDLQPRESIDWFAASEYCAARGARLLTEAEWEYAARGPVAPIYPWGNEFVDDNVVSSWWNTARSTEIVTGRPGGASWVGALNMSGNVWEWTSSIYADYPFDPTDGREDVEDTFSPRVVRGGSCCSYIIADVRATYRFPVAPFMQDPNIGFRCAKD